MNIENGNGFLLPPGAHATIDDGEVKTEGDGKREIPAWLEGQDAERIWMCYRRWAAGERSPHLAKDFGISVATVYAWVAKARAEVPHVIVSTASDLIARREGFTRDVSRVAQEVAASPNIDPVLKVSLMKDLLGTANPYLTAQEEILGFRGGKGGKLHVEPKGENNQTVVFNIDKWLGKQ